MMNGFHSYECDVFNWEPCSCGAEPKKVKTDQERIEDLEKEVEKLKNKIKDSK